MKSTRPLLKKLRSIVSAAGFLLGATSPAFALEIADLTPGTPVFIEVYKRPEGFGIDREFVVVSSREQIVHVSLVSSARDGKETPEGDFGVSMLERTCPAYDDSLLNNCVGFIEDVYALHATTLSAYGMLGRPASSGCVRQSLPDSKRLFAIVSRVGRASVRIRIHETGDRPASAWLPEIRARLDRNAAEIRNLMNEDRAE